MTTEQFIQMLNTEYGMHKEWPKELIVDADTYGNCCLAVFIQEIKRQENLLTFDGMIRISIGKHNGIMFKGIELILKT